MNKLKPEVLLTALCLFIGLGAMFGSFALADAAEQFDPVTLKDMEVIKQGVCEIEGKDDMGFLNGTYICVIVVKDSVTAYTALFNTATGDLLYVIEFTLNGKELDAKVVWKNKVPCTGECA